MPEDLSPIWRAALHAADKVRVSRNPTQLKRDEHADAIIECAAKLQEQKDLLDEAFDLIEAVLDNVESMMQHGHPQHRWALIAKVSVEMLEKAGKR